MWFMLYFVNIVTNLFTSEKPDTPLIHYQSIFLCIPVCKDSSSFHFSVSCMQIPQNRFVFSELLTKRGYTKRSIDNELKKVDKLDRNNWLLYRTDKSKTDRVPLVLTYSKVLTPRPWKIGECMGVTNIWTNSTVPTARFTLTFLFKKHRIMLFVD
jgi:hypothetical protein